MNLSKASNTAETSANHEVLRIVFVGIFVMFTSACATTGGNTNESSHVANQPVKRGCLSDGAGNGECTPEGVIEISENYSVEPAIKKEFKAAVDLLNEEKYPDAIKLLIDVTEKTDKFSAPYINLGIAYERTGDMKKAEESLKHALEINAHHPVALNELGLVYRKTGRYQKARETYQSLLDIYPEFLPARKNLGVLCDIYIQDLGCALAEYEEYLKGKPDDKKMKIWIADVRNRMK